MFPSLNFVGISPPFSFGQLVGSELASKDDEATWRESCEDCEGAGVELDEWDRQLGVTGGGVPSVSKTQDAEGV